VTLEYVTPPRVRAYDRPPAGLGWLHEVKHDDFRIVALKHGEHAKVWSRRGADFTDRLNNALLQLREDRRYSAPCRARTAPEWRASRYSKMRSLRAYR